MGEQRGAKCLLRLFIDIVLSIIERKVEGSEERIGVSRTMNHSLSDRAAPTSQEFITQIYKKYDRLMLFTAKKYLMDLQECEDAVQESLLKLMRRIELLRTLEEPILTSYVVTTVRNTAINILRRQKRDAQNITSFTESVEESIIEPDSIIDIIMDREAKRSLRRRLMSWNRMKGYCSRGSISLDMMTDSCQSCYPVRRGVFE